MGAGLPTEPQGAGFLQILDAQGTGEGQARGGLVAGQAERKTGGELSIDHVFLVSSK